MIPDWARAHGGPVCAARLRTLPEDFVVKEHLGIEPDGTGEHDFLVVQKTGANTAWVARRLARHARVPVRDVGYAGLKDRHAVTTQTFSVRRPNRDGTDWSSLDAEGVAIIEISRHSRKIRRGSHKYNQFAIRLRGDAVELNADTIHEKLAVIAEFGVPNYFGEQRFGRNGANLQLASDVFAGKRLKREQRSIAISAARSFLFNQILDARVCDGSWNRIQAGDIANLDGSNSVFPVEEISDELISRCKTLDIHPTGTLWGRDAPATTGAVAKIEQALAAKHAQIVDGLSGAGLEASSRALRMAVTRVASTRCGDGVMLEFRLPKGGFATAVLRELIEPVRLAG